MRRVLARGGIRTTARSPLPLPLRVGAFCSSGWRPGGWGARGGHWHGWGERRVPLGKAGPALAPLARGASKLGHAPRPRRRAQAPPAAASQSRGSSAARMSPGALIWHRTGAGGARCNCGSHLRLWPWAAATPSLSRGDLRPPGPRQGLPPTPNLPVPHGGLGWAGSTFRPRSLVPA